MINCIFCLLRMFPIITVTGQHGNYIKKTCAIMRKIFLCMIRIQRTYSNDSYHVSNVALEVKVKVRAY